MAGSKETPRQKMVGMMYLVLTCLLALNVSKDILKGFVTVNESLEKTNRSMQQSNEELLKAFEAAAHDSKLAAQYYPKAVESRKLTQAAVGYIEDMKKKLIAIT
ncbi:MAG: gliding motility protein GldM, partial [Bacteroidia bacterium]